MRTPALLLAAALSLPATAADRPAPPPRPATPVLDALRAANEELRASFPVKGDPGPALEAVPAFKFSESTSAKLAAVFGHDHPFLVEKQPPRKGMRRYHVGMQALDYTAPDGSRTTWPALDGDVALSRDGRRAEGSATWPFLQVQDKDGTLRLDGIALDFMQHAGVAGLWLGTAHGAIGEATGRIGNSAFVLPGAGLQVEVRQRGKGIDLGYDLRIASPAQPLRVDNEDVGALRLRFTLAAIPVQTMVALRDRGTELRRAANDADHQKLMASVTSFGRDLAKAGTVLRIDGLELTRKGRTASLAGSLRVARFAGMDTAPLPDLMRHVEGRFTVRVPQEMVLETAQAITRQQMRAKNPGQPVSEDAVRQASQSVADVMVGRMVNGGYATIRKGVIVSEITIKDGVLRANGKEFQPLPAPTRVPGPPQGPGAAAHMPFMPPRRVADRCPLPPFPEQMVRDNPQFGWRYALIIGQDGHVRNVKLQAPSPWPTYDAALTAAVEQCQWIPALIDGKEADFPSSWEIGRDENGEQHWELTGTPAVE